MHGLVDLGSPSNTRTSRGQIISASADENTLRNTRSLDTTQQMVRLVTAMMMGRQLRPHH